MRNGSYAKSHTYQTPLPMTIGMEGVGTVARLGAGVSGLKVGERVGYYVVRGSYAEYAVVPDATAAAVARARRDGRRVTCVGTTAVRATESWARAAGGSRDRLPDVGWHGWTRLFLYPGAPFLVADAMVTNFHVPRSTLLMLVSAFAGAGVVRAAYGAAIEARYRFYSFGDACLFR